MLGKSLTLKGYLYSEIVSDDAALARAKAFIVDGLDKGTLAPKIAKVFPSHRSRTPTATWNRTNRSAKWW